MDLFLIYQYLITLVLLLFFINFLVNNIVFKNTVGFSLPESIRKTSPLVSVLIPARNEADNIKRCLRSLLKQDYPNIEILVLDDNSSDLTSQVVKRLAVKDRRIKLISGKPLKSGWLGKCYACYQLSKQARGKYLIFTDADTLHFPSSISSSIGCLTRNNLDALSIIPRQIMVSFSERMIVSWVHFGILILLPLIFVKKSKNPLFCTANGQFLMFKKEVYKKIGGHQSVKAKVLEDIHIAKQVKRHGYQFMIFDGSKNIYCRMHRSFRELLQGFSKFMFAAFDFKILTMAFVVLLVSALFLLPFILLPLGIFIFDWPRMIIDTTIVQIFIILIIRTMLAVRLKSRILDIFFHPLSMIYIILICINSVLQTRFGKGIYWKGRRYDVFSKDYLELLDDDIINKARKV